MDSAVEQQVQGEAAAAGLLTQQLNEALRLQGLIKNAIFLDEMDDLEELVQQHGSRLQTIMEMLASENEQERWYPAELMGQVRDGLSQLEEIASSRLKVMGNELKKCGELRGALRGYASGASQSAATRRVSTQW